MSIMWNCLKSFYEAIIDGCKWIMGIAFYTTLVNDKITFENLDVVQLGRLKLPLTLFDEDDQAETAATPETKHIFEIHTRTLATGDYEATQHFKLFASIITQEFNKLSDEKIKKLFDQLNNHYVSDPVMALKKNGTTEMVEMICKCRKDSVMEFNQYIKDEDITLQAQSRNL